MNKVYFFRFICLFLLVLAQAGLPAAASAEDLAAARSYLVAGDVWAAKRVAQELLRTNPGNVEALRLDADCSVQLGRHRQAITMYRRAVDLAPADVRLRSALSASLRQRSQYHEAEQQARKAISLDPPFAGGYYELGRLRISQKRRPEAIRELLQASKLDPQNVDILEDLGNLYQEEKQLYKAAKAYSFALQIEKRVSLYNSLGVVYRTLGDVGQATRQFEQAVKLDESDATALNNLGFAEMQKGELDAAVSYFSRAVKAQPRDATSYFNLADAYEARGDSARAIENYRQALAMNPKFAIAHNNMGFVFESTGRLQDARVAYQRALRLEPKNQVFIRNVRNIEKKLARKK